ncbi:unnamed protein product [Knipowitschia caucasica]|uniref:Uncharacterized protein n=1 Tax=Knipowitschia caucasica TaxID=637954 RepID=A0AAV2LBD6_KNICA
MNSAVFLTLSLASAPLRSGVGFGAPRPAAKATAYVSPTIKSPSYRPSPPSTPPHSPGASGLPPPRSALPRPASFSSRGKLGQSPRSFLTPPKSLSTLNALGDAGWRDGCY